MEESDDDSEVEDSDDFTSGSCEENEEDRRESKTQVINFKHSQAEERLQPQEVCVLHFNNACMYIYMQHFDELFGNILDSITISTLACWYSGSAINSLMVVVLYCLSKF